ncbi:MAG: methanol/ethanol family PQQ-dependent dehydrogenase [Gemmatimonadaceae bacterium]
MRARRSLVITLVVGSAAASCGQPGERSAVSGAPGGVAAASPSTAPTPSGARIGTPPAANSAGQWVMPAGDYASSRYSELSDITPSNASQLKAAWTFSTGVLRGHEGQPLVIDNTMYLVTPYPNVAYAIDLTQPGYPLKWKFRPENDDRATGKACCDVVNRGASFAQGMLVYNLLDGHTVAVDAKSGAQRWRTKVVDVATGETITMAPIIVKDLVIVGSSGGEMGVRGFVAALDLTTGRERWRAWNLGPDADVKVGPRYAPFYAQDKGRDLAMTTWPGDAWKRGGAASWGWVSYDPALNLIYYGTSNPGPWNQDQRPGDNKWSAAVLARDADTGELRWAYQFTPHDLWDYDGVNENILVDLPVKGVMRKALVHFDRNAFAYVMDRATGEVLVAEPFAPMNWSTGVDLKTGRPSVNPAKATKQDVLVTDICPSLEGGKNQQPAAFSPATGLFYVPTVNLCMDYKGRAVQYYAGTPYIGADAPEKGGPGGYKGEFIAWDAAAGKKVWGIKEPFPVWGGALATKGGVVFYGTLDGWFKAVDASSGKVLWQFKVGSGVVGNPVTYRGPDGKQYVAIYAGVGGDMGALIAGDVASNLPYDVRERGTTLPDLARYTSWGGMLFVFSL